MTGSRRPIPLANILQARETLSIFACPSAMTTTFLSLPLELRNKIYPDLFTDDVGKFINIAVDEINPDRTKDPCYNICSEQQFQQAPCSSWPNIPSHPIHTSILLTCHRTYHEPSLIPYNDIQLFHSRHIRVLLLTFERNDSFHLPSLPGFEDPWRYLPFTIMPLSSGPEAQTNSPSLCTSRSCIKILTPEAAALGFFAMHATSLKSVFLVVGFGHAREKVYEAVVGRLREKCIWRARSGIWDVSTSLLLKQRDMATEQRSRSGLFEGLWMVL